MITREVEGVVQNNFPPFSCESGYMKILEGYIYIREMNPLRQ